MELYKVNNNATYLNRARDVVAFSMSGENGAPGGSLRWHEGDTYWNDAHHIGLAMETSYVDWTTHALRETGQWGGHDMTAAFTELYQLDGDVYWLNIAAGYLSYLHNNLKDANGRYPETWNAAAG